MNIQAVIQRERAPFLKAFEQAKSAHDKRVQQSQKTIDAARARFEADVSKANSELAVSEQAVRDTLSRLEQFNQDAESASKGDQGSTNGRRASATPKTKAAPKAKTAAAPPKAKAAAAPKAKTKTVGGNSAAIKGRDEVRAGLRPPIKDAIRLILGKKTMRSRDITAALIERKWAPRSANIASYVPYVLSNGSKGANAVFESVQTGEGRGFYRVRVNAPPMDPKVRARWANGAVGEVKVEAQTAPAPKKVAAAAPKKAPAKAAAAQKAATTPKKSAGGPRKCSECGVLGHNRRGHDAWVKAQAQSPVKTTANGAAHKPAAPKKTAAAKSAPATAAAPKAAAPKAAATPKAAAPKAAKAAAPKKAPAAKAAPVQKAGKGEQKCSVCGTKGHNKKGHDAFAQAQGAAAKSKPAEETPPPPASSPNPPAPSAEVRIRTADEIVAEQRAKTAQKPEDVKDSVMEEAAAAFGS